MSIVWKYSESHSLADKYTIGFQCILCSLATKPAIVALILFTSVTLVLSSKYHSSKHRQALLSCLNDFLGNVLRYCSIDSNRNTPTFSFKCQYFFWHPNINMGFYLYFMLMQFNLLVSISLTYLHKPSFFSSSFLLESSLLYGKIFPGTSAFCCMQEIILVVFLLIFPVKNISSVSCYFTVSISKFISQNTQSASICGEELFASMNFFFAVLNSSN